MKPTPGKLYRVLSPFHVWSLEEKGCTVDFALNSVYMLTNITELTTEAVETNTPEDYKLRYFWFLYGLKEVRVGVSYAEFIKFFCEQR